jgi:hypothetical protein
MSGPVADERLEQPLTVRFSQKADAILVALLVIRDLAAEPGDAHVAHGDASLGLFAEWDPEDLREALLRARGPSRGAQGDREPRDRPVALAQAAVARVAAAVGPGLARDTLHQHVQPRVANPSGVQSGVPHEFVNLTGRTLTATLTVDEHVEVHH